MTRPFRTSTASQRQLQPLYNYLLGHGQRRAGLDELPLAELQLAEMSLEMSLRFLEVACAGCLPPVRDAALPVATR